jgi:hypothetical protein
MAITGLCVALKILIAGYPLNAAMGYVKNFLWLSGCQIYILDMYVHQWVGNIEILKILDFSSAP